MAQSTFRHTDDDGAISIFISGTGDSSDILFVCEHRHWWTVSAAQAGSASKAATKRARAGTLHQKALSRADKPLADLGSKFGPEVYKALRIE